MLADAFSFPPDIIAASERLLATLGRTGGRLVTAESLTAGLISAAVASVPGSSAVLEAGFVVYSCEQKASALGVSASLLRDNTAYDPQVALQMARGALKGAPRATLAVAVTGVAGPGPSDGKPAGLVYLAVVTAAGQEVVREHVFVGGRMQVRLQTVRAALLEAALAANPGW